MCVEHNFIYDPYGTRLYSYYVFYIFAPRELVTLPYVCGDNNTYVLYTFAGHRATIRCI